jgi:hypothetical protein
LLERRAADGLGLAFVALQVLTSSSSSSSFSDVIIRFSSPHRLTASLPHRPTASSPHHLQPPPPGAAADAATAAHYRAWLVAAGESFGRWADQRAATVRAAQGWLSALSVFI